MAVEKSPVKTSTPPPISPTGDAPAKATGAWLIAVAIDAVFGAFYTLGGLALVAAGEQIAGDAEEAAVNLHTGLVYLPVGLALLGAAAVLLMRRPWSYALGVWLNSLGVVTAVFMFARAMILRATTPTFETATGAAGMGGVAVVDVRMVTVLVVQTALFSLAIWNCMKLQKAALEAVAKAAAAQTAADDPILPASRR